MVPHPTHGNRKLEELPRLSRRSSKNPADPRNKQEMMAWEQARRITLETCDQTYRRLDVQWLMRQFNPNRSCGVSRFTTIGSAR